MKIVNRKEFLKLPAETVFSYLEDPDISAPEIKGETLGNGNDFYCQDLTNPLDTNNFGDYVDLIEKMKLGKEVAVDLDIQQRDGLFEKDQLFCVWSKEDVSMLINRLAEALVAAY